MFHPSSVLTDINMLYWKVSILCYVVAICVFNIHSLTIITRGDYDNYTDIKTFSHGPWISKFPKKGEKTNRYNADYNERHKKLNSQSLICYYTLPKNKDSLWELDPSEIDTHLCTHVIIGFASVLDNLIHLEEVKWVEKSIRVLRNRNPRLKVMLSIAGMSEVQGGFPEMVKNESNRKRFVKSSLEIIQELNLDGIDLDWEFPAWSNGDERERGLFVKLLQEMRRELDLEKKNLLLSVAVAAPVSIIDKSYNVPNIAKYVDFVSLMSYDYHAYVWYIAVTGHNAPLYPHNQEPGYESTLNVNYSAAYWMWKGMPREKLIIGIPTYGHSFTLTNPANHGLSSPTKGFGKLGEAGFVRYVDVCLFLKYNATRCFDFESKVPYAFSNDEWISYDDEESIEEKAIWIKSGNFGGAMIFSLNTDDWSGNCLESEKKVTFPLTRVVHRILRNASLE